MQLKKTVCCRLRMGLTCQQLVICPSFRKWKKIFKSQLLMLNIQALQCRMNVSCFNAASPGVSMHPRQSRSINMMNFYFIIVGILSYEWVRILDSPVGQSKMPKIICPSWYCCQPPVLRCSGALFGALRSSQLKLDFFKCLYPHILKPLHGDVQSWI